MPGAGKGPGPQSCVCPGRGHPRKFGLFLFPLRSSPTLTSGPSGMLKLPPPPYSQLPRTPHLSTDGRDSQRLQDPGREGLELAPAATGSPAGPEVCAQDPTSWCARLVLRPLACGAGPQVPQRHVDPRGMPSVSLRGWARNKGRLLGPCCRHHRIACAGSSVSARPSACASGGGLLPGPGILGEPRKTGSSLLPVSCSGLPPSGSRSGAL